MICGNDEITAAAAIRLKKKSLAEEMYPRAETVTVCTLEAPNTNGNMKLFQANTKASKAAAASPGRQREQNLKENAIPGITINHGSLLNIWGNVFEIASKYPRSVTAASPVDTPK